MPKTQKRTCCHCTEWQKHITELTSWKNLFSLYWMIKIKTRKYCCLNSLRFVLLNDISTKKKNMFACHFIKWQKHTKQYSWLKILLHIKTHKIITSPGNVKFDPKKILYWLIFGLWTREGIYFQLLERPHSAPLGKFLYRQQFLLS